jgi:hypothetical protein
MVSCHGPAVDKISAIDKLTSGSREGFGLLLSYLKMYNKVCPIFAAVA